MKQQWLEFWQARNARERMILTYGSIFLALALLYGMAWLPVSEQRRKLSASLPHLRTQAAQLRSDAQQVIALRANTSAASGSTSAKSSVENGLQAMGLRDKVNAIDRVDDHRVRITFNAVAFDGLLGFLEAMQSEQRLRVEALQMEGLPQTGRVKGTATVAGPEGTP
ncbi:MAG: type II secretion system protein M [Burkholderiales bacterium]